MIEMLQSIGSSILLLINLIYSVEEAREVEVLATKELQTMVKVPIGKKIKRQNCIIQPYKEVAVEVEAAINRCEKVEVQA